MGIREVINQTLQLAKIVAPMIPELGAGEAIAEKIMGIFDDLHKHATLGEQIAMQEDRKLFRAKVVEKAKAEAVALRGG